MAALSVVIVVTQMEAGGAQVAAMRVAAGLRNRGYQAETWFLYEKRPVFAGLDDVRVILPGLPRGVRDYCDVTVRLVRLLREQRPDVVVTFTHYSNILGQIAAVFAGVRCRVASQRNPSWSYPWAARWMDLALGTIGGYDANVAVSRTTAESFARYPARYQKHLKVVPNGIAAPKLSISKEEVRRQFGLPSSAPLVVTVGRLARQKNQSVLIEALLSCPGVHLAIVGEGEIRSSLEALATEFGITDRIHLLGELEQSIVSDILQAADIFAMPSRFEGMSNALLEAISVGLPIIASDIAAQAEVLRPNDFDDSVGILLPHDQVDEWARAIRLLAWDEVMRKTLAMRSKMRAQDFTIDSMVDGFERTILECLKLA